MLATAPRYLFFALYAAAVLILLDQATEVTAQLAPSLELSNPQFRFAAFGLIIGRTTTAVIFDVLLILGALGLHHRKFLRVWGLLHLLAAALLLAGLVLFLLDTVELRNRVATGAQTVFVIAAARATIMVALSVVYCVWVMVATGQAARGGSTIDKRNDEGPLLVTGA